MPGGRCSSPEPPATRSIAARSAFDLYQKSEVYEAPARLLAGCYYVFVRWWRLVLLFAWQQPPEEATQQRSPRGELGLVGEAGAGRVRQAALQDIAFAAYTNHPEGLQAGLEGVVAKKAGAPYRSGRSADWLKIRADLVDDFVVVGWTDPTGGRPGFGALHLAAYADGTLTYAGRVGSGFSDQQLQEVAERLTAAEAAEGVVFARYKQSAVDDLDVTVTFEDGVLEVDVYLNAPVTDDGTDAETVADEAARTARDAVDDMFGE